METVLDYTTSTIVPDFYSLGMYQKKKKKVKIREVRHKVTTCTVPIPVLVNLLGVAEKISSRSFV